jgi:integrase
MSSPFNDTDVPEVVEATTSLRKAPDGDYLFIAGRRASNFRPDGICENPDCSEVVPGGYSIHRKKTYFCSPRCQAIIRNRKHILGICEHCGDPIFGLKDKNRNSRFCSIEHNRLFEADRILGPTGPFRPLIEEYMSLTKTYSKSTLSSVKPSLAHFFAHVFTVEKMTELAQIGPAVVSRFRAAEVRRGMTSSNAIGHISTFFNWLLDHERFNKRNPVISRVHSQKSAPAEARPYADKDIESIWNLVDKSGGLILKLAFHIGLECGLRVGEVANIRLEDIDQTGRKIFIRLPTKNRETRTVPYHDGVAKHLALWLEHRDPDCPHDGLLHGLRNAMHDTHSINKGFKDLLRKEDSPACHFKFHRLRHTWATRLMNNGMELAVLKVLGGWTNWNSMQKYIKVLDGTVRRQYEEAYRKLQEKPEARKEVTLSLMDFAALAALDVAAKAPDVAAKARKAA